MVLTQGIMGMEYLLMADILKLLDVFHIIIQMTDSIAGLRDKGCLSIVLPLLTGPKMDAETDPMGHGKM